MLNYFRMVRNCSFGSFIQLPFQPFRRAQICAILTRIVERIGIFKCKETGKKCNSPSDSTWYQDKEEHSLLSVPQDLHFSLTDHHFIYKLGYCILSISFYKNIVLFAIILNQRYASFPICIRAKGCMHNHSTSDRAIRHDLKLPLTCFLIQKVS